MAHRKVKGYSHWAITSVKAHNNGTWGKLDLYLKTPTLKVTKHSAFAYSHNNIIALGRVHHNFLRRSAIKKVKIDGGISNFKKRIAGNLKEKQKCRNYSAGNAIVL